MSIRLRIRLSLASCRTSWSESRESFITPTAIRLAHAIAATAIGMKNSLVGIMVMAFKDVSWKCLGRVLDLCGQDASSGSHMSKLARGGARLCDQGHAKAAARGRCGRPGLYRKSAYFNFKWPALDFLVL